jgi:hypothetical protein
MLEIQAWEGPGIKQDCENVQCMHKRRVKHDEFIITCQHTQSSDKL